MTHGEPWECDLCGTGEVPNTERFIEIDGVHLLAMTCSRCGYPYTTKPPGVRA